MATLADELLADLMGSDSEGEEESNSLPDEDGNTSAVGLYPVIANGDVEMDKEEDDDNEHEPDTEDSMMAAAAAGKSAVTEAEDEIEAKARVEKMDFGGISDVRSVAGLMKTLKPVLEVSSRSPYSPHSSKESEFTIN
jgi:U4/U6 small nuclear ribonucleoprotein PRP31